MALNDSFKKFARLSREIDMSTAEGQRLRDFDIERLFDTLSRGVDQRYISNVYTASVGAISGECCVGPIPCSGEVEHEPEFCMGETDWEPKPCSGEVDWEPIPCSGEVQPIIGGEAMGGEVEIGPVPISGEKDGTP